MTEAALPDVATASRQLGALIARPVTEADLPGLRDRSGPPFRPSTHCWQAKSPTAPRSTPCPRQHRARRLAVSGGELRERIVWDDATAAAELARRLVGN